MEADCGRRLYRSDDAGATWNCVNGEQKLRERAWYYMRVIYADPKDTNRVYAPQRRDSEKLGRRQDLTRLHEPHGDNHDLWIAPNDPARA